MWSRFLSDILTCSKMPKRLTYYRRAFIHGIVTSTILLGLVSIFFRPMKEAPLFTGSAVSSPNSKGVGSTRIDLLQMLPSLPYHGLNCPKIFDGDVEAIAYASNLHYPASTLQDQLSRWSCSEFTRRRGYLTSPVNQEEAEFPLAFSLLVYKEESQVERLLRAVYRIQNVYCIHVDASAPDVMMDVMSALADCLQNVFIVENPVDVSWGTWSVVQAELICMAALMKRHKYWKYFINLTGQEFPLKTNLELVKILKTLNGSNAVQGVQGVQRKRWWDLPSPPVNVTLTKGECHVTVSRAFVDYVLNDERSLAFREWVKQTKIPDELYFPSLAHSPQMDVPGSYTGYPQVGIDGYTYITRYKCWTSANCTCHGTERRWLCILGPGDLASLVDRRELFVNKFQVGYRPAAFDCMEELHYNRTRDDILGDVSRLNISFYEGLPNGHNHLPS